jgi:hypothetical protein
MTEAVRTDSPMELTITDVAEEAVNEVTEGCISLDSLPSLVVPATQTAEHGVLESSICGIALPKDDEDVVETTADVEDDMEIVGYKRSVPSGNCHYPLCLGIAKTVDF